MRKMMLMLAVGTAVAVVSGVVVIAVASRRLKGFDDFAMGLEKDMILGYAFGR